MGLWELVVRFRTWIANLGFALLVVLPDLMQSPEMIALVPLEYQRYALAAAFLLNIWLRPRPAVIASDPEVLVSRGKADDRAG